jgi:hypothetical protein
MEVARREEVRDASRLRPGEEPFRGLRLDLARDIERLWVHGRELGLAALLLLLRVVVRSLRLLAGLAASLGRVERRLPGRFALFRRWADIFVTVAVNVAETVLGPDPAQRLQLRVARGDGVQVLLVFEVAIDARRRDVGTEVPSG